MPSTEQKTDTIHQPPKTTATSTDEIRIVDNDVTPSQIKRLPVSGLSYGLTGAKVTKITASGNFTWDTRTKHALVRLFGAGGGGGGSTQTGTLSGAGGAGGRGEIQVYEFF